MVKKYKCGIVGHPLQSPRSVKLWNFFFKKKRISSTMSAYNVHPKKIIHFLNNFKKNKKFIALAVTMPYKKLFFNFLSKKDNICDKSKSTNLVIKVKDQLHGFNTDVYGALKSIETKIEKFSDIMIIGLGGTGEAIFNYLHSKFKKKTFYLISSKFSVKKSNVKCLKKVSQKIIGKKLLIINCTPLGSNLKKSYLSKSPLPLRFFSKINRKTFIFDIVYSPKKTYLSKLCKKYRISYLNGLKMNTIQAKLGLKILKKIFNKKK